MGWFPWAVISLTSNSCTLKDTNLTKRLNKQGPKRRKAVIAFIFFLIFLNLFFKFYFIFKLYKIVLVLPNNKMNLPQVYMCSPSWALLPPPSPYHPSGSSQCTSPKHPVSCIEPGLVTRSIYDIIHISMPFSQIIPPSPSPTESKSCSIHQCLFCCLVYTVIVTIFLNSIYMR